jgi:NAD(P)-dependent dehydrogenase (short-subunit alcohol dehydrogenase family)
MSSLFKDDALAGKLAVITGGGTGMGADMAVGFARLGADVLPLSRNPDHLRTVVEQIHDLGRRSEALVCDVRDADAVRRTFDDVAERYGHVDILVNGAAGNFRCAALDLSPNAWRVVIDIDLNGTFLCSQAVARHMLRQGSGTILNITGDFVEAHGEAMAHAAAAKAGIWNLTRSLAKEWGPAIRVNSLAPGPIQTPHGVRALGSQNRFERLAAAIPLRRIGECSEVTEAAAFLVSDAASYVTGAALAVDGGHSFSGYDLPLDEDGGAR